MCYYKTGTMCTDIFPSSAGFDMRLNGTILIKCVIKQYELNLFFTCLALEVTALMKRVIATRALEFMSVLCHY